MKEVATASETNPTCVPVVCERSSTSSSVVPRLQKRKYLVPGDVTFGQFMYAMRKRLKLQASQAIFFFVDSDMSLPNSGAVMRHVYMEKKDDDGFLYLRYTGENTFGWRARRLTGLPNASGAT